MKLPAFDYACPTSLDEALHLLAAGGGEARVLAGGQSLVPLLAFRLAAPKMLVDMRGLRGLRAITIDAESVHVGAMTRWRDVADHPDLAAALPLLPVAVSYVAHYQIQNRGTIGGSLAHADPAAEFPGVAVTCDAQIEIAGASGPRVVAAADLFVGPLETALDSGDIITGVRFARWPMQRRWAFEEFARRRGDYAIAAIALFYDVEDGQVANAHIGVIGATDKPRRLFDAEALLNGRALDETAIAAAASAAASCVEPPSDLQGSADYRRSLVATLLTRALRKTLSEATR